jgi:hypothetical protein
MASCHMMRRSGYAVELGKNILLEDETVNQCRTDSPFPHQHYTSIYGCGILPLTYLSSAKTGK